MSGPAQGEIALLDQGETVALSDTLKGLRILVLEDEFLIAMDVEQLCRDHGAENVVIVRSLEEMAPDASEFDAAIIDVLLGGVSTLEFAARLRDENRPFVFASGYTDNQEIARLFPGVALIGKPYSGTDLIEAVALACSRVRGSGGG
jgi:CheY-like chemotaxis protein